ncbi:MAG: holo-ACP synthase [Candidatus Eisenbacteria bacterium]
MGIGIDVIEVARIGAVLDRHGERFLRRIYTPGEQAAVHGVPAQYWAARFAVKEAAFKALGTGWARGVRWVDVEVSNLATGQPVLSFHGDAERRALGGWGRPICTFRSPTPKATRWGRSCWNNGPDFPGTRPGCRHRERAATGRMDAVWSMAGLARSGDQGRDSCDSAVAIFLVGIGAAQGQTPHKYGVMPKVLPREFAQQGSDMAQKWRADAMPLTKNRVELYASSRRGSRTFAAFGRRSPRSIRRISWSGC